LDGGQPLDDALLRLERFTWVAFTAVNAVAATLARSERRGVRRRFERLKIAVVGGSTARRVETDLGRPPDLVPQRHDAASLAAAFPEPTEDDRCFVPMATDGRPDLVDGLTARGWDVWAAAAYRTVHPTLSDHLVEVVHAADVVTFASPSAVRGHLEQTGGQLPRSAVCIGNTTAAACRELDIEVAAIAEEQSMPGLVAAVLEVVG
ncbi:MAG: uroporphyrinogen-III synthase, partial [Actinomycetota bacterium]|nr:uroporphyrinogen-III synthase [Actinomycetota bacterium]